MSNSANTPVTPVTPDPPAGSTTTPAAFSGVLMWKNDLSGSGTYASETTLAPSNVNPQQFGKKAVFTTDGMLLAQPLYVSGLKLADGTTHNAVILATEHDSIYAFDADSTSTTPLWQRNYLDPANGVTTAPDNYGGRTTIGGEIGITGTPVIDPQTGAMYFVTMLSRNGTLEQWLRAVDVRTGKDFGPGSIKIAASVPGDGDASVNGQIAFDPSIQNQRPGLLLHNGAVYIAWGSFSDWGVYHGWLMAYDAATLTQKVAFNSTTQHQSTDSAYGPADFGGGGAFWQGGAAPSMDSDGNLYIVAGDGSFNADTGGNNHGDSVLKLSLGSTGFQLLDWFTPSNQACIDAADIEIGSGGLALLPDAIGNGRKLAVAINKEGRLYLLDRSNLGKYNAAADSQIPQEFMVGNNTCFSGMGTGYAEGSTWQRLYGNPSYWNGNIYLATANGPIRAYQFVNGLLNTTPTSVGSSTYGFRGGNTVVSANGTSNGIVWAYEKSSNGGEAVLHAYDATNLSTELWNSNMNASRDNMAIGVGFGTPVVAAGRVFVTADHNLYIYGAL